MASRPVPAARKTTIDRGSSVNLHFNKNALTYLILDWFADQCHPVIDIECF